MKNDYPHKLIQHQSDQFRFKLIPTGAILKVIFLFMIAFIMQSVHAVPHDPVKKPFVKIVTVGGDFSLDLVASAPLTYNHATGGGSYDDRTIGRNMDVVESLEGGDFRCGDHVSYLTAIKVSASAIGTQTIKLDYSFLAAATGQPGVALGAFTYVGINSGVVSGGDGTGGTDMGMISNGNETATLDGGYPGTIHGILFQKGATLDGTVTITGLQANEQVIVRVDVLIKCQIPSSPTGNLQASITGGRVSDPVFNKRDATISVGNQTVPFKNVNLIGQADCLLADNTAVCVGQTVVYTAGTTISGASFAWSLSGDAIFVDTSGGTISTPGNTNTARVKATNAGSGTYICSVIVSALQHDPATCTDTVAVNAIPSRPSVTYNPPACDETTFSITVTAPLDSTGVDYEYSNNGGTSWQDSVNFRGITAGSGFSVTVRRKSASSCVSSATTCSNYLTPATSLARVPVTEVVNLPSKKSGSFVKAFPNPYNDHVSFEVRPVISGRATLELFTLMGEKVATVFNGNLKAGESRIFEFRASPGNRGNLIYVFKMGNEKLSAKLLTAGR
jgi:hypothetical protein